MGGLVGRATMMQSNFLPGSISALITLGTPHRLTYTSSFCFFLFASLLRAASFMSSVH
jgi:hypothetical protein